MYTEDNGLWIAYSADGPLSIEGKMANRHGLVAGATGTGKTVTLQVMAETFCQAGVPCFMADMKGDLSGISQAGKTSSFIEKRKIEFGVNDPQFRSCPVRFFDVYGEQGHPIRATISEMGPQLLSRLLGLNDTQTGVLNIVFRIADENKLLLDDIKDLRAMLDFVLKNAKEVASTYGNVSSASVGAIQRSLLELENQGGDKFFGLPSFDIQDLLQTQDGKGIMNVLAADKLMLQPKLYSTFLMWMLTELYSSLPEVGDLPLPKLIFFFDEAHMMFDGTSKAMKDKLEQVIRLIRSKGVGIYFVSQSPADIPDEILGQLGNRIQHALRAYTPKDQKAVKTAAQTFRANPAFKTEEAITQLETGEALVSFLDAKGAPTMVQKARILFPLSQIGAITDDQRKQIITSSDLHGKYDEAMDRESAFEVLLRQAEEQVVAEEQAAQQTNKEAATTKSQSSSGSLFSKILKAVATAAVSVVATSAGSMVSDAISGKKTKSSTSTSNKIVKRATTAATRTVAKEITRGALGNLLK